MSGLLRILLVGIVSLQFLPAENFTPLDQFGAGTNQGVAWGDYDNDGDIDLLVAGKGFSRLYKNQGSNTFLAVDSFATLFPYGVAWTDYDNDGILDFVIGDSTGIWVYSDSFEKKTFIAGGPVRGVSWGDYNNDGSVDLAVAIYGGPNRLYRNDGSGNFLLVVNAFGSTADSTNGITWADYNNDGWLDLVVANQHSQNRLYKNDHGNFVEQSFDPTVRNSYGAAWGDYNNDGWLDLLVTNFGDTNCLYQNGNGVFAQLGGVFSTVDSSTEATWGDFNNDGQLDFATANIHGVNKLFHNNGNGSFTELSPFESVSDSSFGIACADYNDDGDLDLAVAKHGQNRLYQNNLNDKNYIKVRLVGRGKGYTNSAGIGARVFLFKSGTDTLFGLRELNGGGGFSSQDAIEAHFGVAAGDYDVVVSWPASGIVDSVTSVSSPDTLTILEDQMPPHNPDTVFSTTHTPVIWSSNRTIIMVWSGASDPGGSGVKGYSYRLDTLSTGLPDTIIDNLQPDTAFSTELGFNTGRLYFHLRTVDSLGNWNPNAVSVGPYRIDATKPTPPVLVLPSNGIRTNQTRSSLTWHKPIDLSGISEYTLQVAFDSNFKSSEWQGNPSDTTQEIELTPGKKFWRVRASDSADNVGDWSSVFAFTIDTISPTVLATNPRDSDEGVALTSNVIVTFKENDVDPTTVTTNTFTVTGNKTGSYSGTISFAGGNYIFNPDNDFKALERITCLLTTGIKDSAANNFSSNYTWSFMTGSVEDSLGPITSNISAQPETTKGAPFFVLGAKVSDVGRGESPIIQAEFFIDLREENGTGQIMQGNFGNKEVMVVDTVDTTGILRGPHIFYIHGLDASNNWGPFDSVTVWITGPDVQKPELTIKTEPDTIEIGDSLTVRVTSSKPLSQIEITIRTSDNIRSFLRVDAVDSLHYVSIFNAIGIKEGLAMVLVDGFDRSGNPGIDSASFYIQSPSNLLSREKVYVWPNPANTDIVHFHYFVTSNADVDLYIYTLTGELVSKRSQTGAQAGYSKNEFTVNISNLPNDLYIFKIEATASDGSKSGSVMKKFVIVR